jgi:hypothetical protein
VRRIGRVVLVLALAAVPIGVGGKILTASSPASCFATSSATYRIVATTARPDFIVKVTDGDDAADLRLQLVEQPEMADFVLVDDADSPDACPGASSIRTIQASAGAQAPDLTVSLTAQPHAADRKIFVRSEKFTPQQAAALFAVIVKALPRRDVARR